MLYTYWKRNIVSDSASFREWHPFQAAVELSTIRESNKGTGWEYADKDPYAIQTDSVNHPTHYKIGSIEVIDFIEDQKLDYHSGNAVKYICRAGRKDPAKEREDILKGIWYLQRKADKLLKGEQNALDKS